MILLSRRFTQFYARPRLIGNKKRKTPSTGEESGLQLSLCMKENTQPEQIGPMTSYSVMCGVILLYLCNSTTHDPATCLSNKLTNLIYDGVREVDCNRPRKMKEGSSATNKTSRLKEQEGGQ